MDYNYIKINLFLDSIMQEDVPNFISNFKEEDPINKIIFNIISLIKTEHDYDLAIDLIKQNNIKLEDIVSRSVRLSLVDFVKLADLMILNKGK